MTDTRTTWRALITSTLEVSGESWDDVIACTLTQEELDIEFWEGFGSVNGKPFTLWTEKRVYFPATYDGGEWCDCVPRNPCDEVTEHIGG